MSDQDTMFEHCTCGHFRVDHDGNAYHCYVQSCSCPGFIVATAEPPAVSQPAPESPLCVCGHSRVHHWHTAAHDAHPSCEATGCDCREYRPAPAQAASAEPAAAEDDLRPEYDLKELRPVPGGRRQGWLDRQLQQTSVTAAKLDAALAPAASAEPAAWATGIASAHKILREVRYDTEPCDYIGGITKLCMAVSVLTSAVEALSVEVAQLREKLRQQ